MNSTFKHSANDPKASPFNRVKMNRNLVAIKNTNRQDVQTPTNDDSVAIYTLDRTCNPNGHSQESNNYLSKSLNHKMKPFYDKMVNSSFHNSSF